MNFDNAIIQIFLPIINQGLIDKGLTNISVLQSAQPTQQGIEIEPAVYFQKTATKRYGFPEMRSTWDDELDQEILIQTQQLESTFKAQALVTQNPNDIDSLTANDILNIVADILQSDQTVQELNIHEIGILRVPDLQVSYFVDDRGRFEAAPFLSFILVYSQSTITPVDSTQTVYSGIYRV